MNVLLSIVLGLVAGVLAMLAVYRTFPQDVWGWIGALLVGMIGGWAGRWLFNILGLEVVNWLGALVVAFIGASVVLLLLRRLGPQQTTGRTGA